MTDLADIGVYPDPSRSTWAKVKAFPQNVEIEASLVFSPGQQLVLLAVRRRLDPGPPGADRGALRPLDAAGGRHLQAAAGGRPGGPFPQRHPRLQRRHARDAQGPLPHPLEPGKGRPHGRKIAAQAADHLLDRADGAARIPAVRAEGILEWNKAFEKVGFIDAIQVRDQQADDEFDPEDIRYNVFRWVTTSAGLPWARRGPTPRRGRFSTPTSSSTKA